MITLFSHIFFFTKDYALIVQRHFQSLIYNNPPTHWKIGTKGDVVVIPGYMEKWVFLRTLAEFLNKLGYRVHILRSLEETMHSIEDSAQIVTAYIAQKQLHRVILLSHSQGGLVAKLILDNPKSVDAIDTSISIAIPYGGTVWGYLYYFGLKDLRPDSDMIRRMKSNSAVHNKVLNIFPKYDNHVIPHNNLILEGAKNICLDVTGHTNILESPLTRHAIVEHLS